MYGFIICSDSGKHSRQVFSRSTVDYPTRESAQAAGEVARDARGLGLYQVITTPEVKPEPETPKDAANVRAGLEVALDIVLERLGADHEDQEPDFADFSSGEVTAMQDIRDAIQAAIAAI